MMLSFERDEGIERLRTQRNELDSLLVRYRQEDANLDQRLERDLIQLTAQQQLEQKQEELGRELVAFVWEAGIKRDEWLGE